MAKSTVTVTREQAVNLFVSLGLKTASKRSDKELLSKLQKINTLVDETTDTGDDALNDLLDDILQAETIEMESKEDKEVAQEKSAVKGKKKKVKVTSTTSPTEEAAEAPKKAKKKVKAQPKAKTETAGKKKKVRVVGKGKKGAGVIAAIVEALQKGPKTKKEVVDILAKQFPNRTAEAMAGTVSVQLSGRLKKDKGLTVQKDKDGKYFIK